MYRCNSIRLSRYLYSLGFEKISKRDENGNEYWLFKISTNLQKELEKDLPEGYELSVEGDWDTFDMGVTTLK